MSGSPMIEPYAGFWGKLPAHGDFLRAGLSDGVISRLDRWVSEQMTGARTRHGERFDDLWHRAPTWYFTIRSNILENGYAVSGIWTPSIDAAGRCFPFIFLILHDPAHAFYRGLSSFDAVIRKAIELTQPVATMEEALGIAGCVPIPSAAPVHDVWWCVGNSSQGTIHGALPVKDAFDWLIEGTAPNVNSVVRQGAADGADQNDIWER